MTPEEYCVQRAGGHGSSLYYALLRADPDQRRALLAVHAFWQEASEWSAEPGVSARRLAWWSEEITATFRGAPRHPISLALAEAIATFGFERKPFETLLASAASALGAPPCERLEDLERGMLACGHALGALAAAVCRPDDPGTPPAAAALGLRLQFARRLRALGLDARRGRLPLPLEDLRRFDLAPPDLRTRAKPEALARLLAFETGRAERWIDEALAALPAADRKRLLPLVILAQIERATLREFARDGAAVLEHAVALTPLRKLWIAWRATHHNR